MSPTPQKIYSRLGEKICRLCGSEKDFDRSMNIFSKIGGTKKLQKITIITELLNISITQGDCHPPSAITAKEC